MRQPLTSLQNAVLAYIRAFNTLYDNMPSSRDIARHFGYRSQTGAISHLNALVRKGYLERLKLPGHTRALYRFQRPTTQHNETTTHNMPPRLP